MKKQFLNLGKALNKAEQKQIFGGKAPFCEAPTVACYFPAINAWECVMRSDCFI